MIAVMQQRTLKYSENTTDNIRSYFLYPGTIYCSKAPINIQTILGSCVSVCLWDSILLQGGMNHFMLPYWNGEGLISPKYGNEAIVKLIKKMENLGSDQSNLVAKIFGGGNVLQFKNDFFNIGQRNIALAEKLLREKKIPVIARSIGGEKGRKIIFNTSSGKVQLRFVDSHKKI